MRNKEFVINSIKMDLHRVVTAAGDISKPLPKQSVTEFLSHAIGDFDKVETTALEKDLRSSLISLNKEINQLNDPHKRLRWTEDVLTVRCRL